MADPARTARPYTFAVLAIAILLGGGLAARTVQKDLFPNIDTPVISVIWTYPGLGVFDFERRSPIRMADCWPLRPSMWC